MLSLTPLEPGPIPVECDHLAPDRLVGLTPSQIAVLPLYWGNRLVTLADFFRVEGSPDDGVLEFRGDCSSVKRIGARVKSGTVRVLGSAGMHLGAEMTGGEIVVGGNVNDWAGAEMRGGTIRIDGNAGDHLGGAYPGSVRGMKGGMIQVRGNAGHEVGANLRRGLIAVKGNIGDFAGIAMIAGSILVGGSLGIRPGAGMKRGTILSLKQLPELPPCFQYDCDYEPTFLRLYFRKLNEMGFGFEGDLSRCVVRRYSGDLLALGKGEILERVG